MTKHRAAVVVALVTVLAGLPATAAVPSQRSAKAQNLLDAEWLERVLEINPGSTDGELTVLVAAAVGRSGRVLSNDLNTDRVKTIAAAAAAAGRTNVMAIQGAESETKFPDQCCDAIFMRDVYHHFGDPPAMNASILKALKPGGHLAIIDFTPPPTPGSENPPGHRGEDNHHGITAATLARELTAAGFEVVEATTEDRAVKVVARRPR